MSYNPVTDFLGLLRTSAAGVRNARMPGLDFLVSALARIGFINLSVGPNPPIVNQAATVWLQPAVPSWSAEGAFFLWNPSLQVYQPATPALWTLILQAALSPSNILPLINGIAAAGVSLFYSRADHVHPTDVTRAPLNSPLFTGTPEAPTPNPGDNSPNLATTAFVQAAVSAAVVPIPIGTLIPYAGPTAPSANWAIANGQVLNRITFASLFAIIGTTFGAGDGVSTFGVPDMRGRTVAGVDGGVGRLTTATMTSQALGGVGGLETSALTAAQIPTITSNATNTITVAAANGGANIPSTNSSIGTVGNAAEAGFDSPATGNTTNWLTTSSWSGSNAINVTSNNTSGAVHSNMQPTIELNYIIRVS